MILSKSCPLSRLSKHCHSELTAPFIDQRWLQEPCLVSDLQGVLHPFSTMFLWGHSRKKRCLSEMWGRRSVGSFYELSKAQGMSSISYLVTEKS